MQAWKSLFAPGMVRDEAGSGAASREEGLEMEVQGRDEPPGKKPKLATSVLAAQ